MHCADCTICFLHLQNGGREERGVVAGGENTEGEERELNKEGKKKRKTRDRDKKNKAGKRGGEEGTGEEVERIIKEEEEGEGSHCWLSGVRR